MAAVREGHFSERWLRMGDVELVKELWRTIGRIDDDEISDTLYWIAGEMLERWAPEVEQADVEIDYAHDKNREAELRDHAEVVARRRRARAIHASANEKAAAVWTKAESDA